MASEKIAITIPKDLLLGIDAAASERGESRSGFISRILRTALEARHDSGVTHRLNELFVDERVVIEQDRSTREVDSTGTDWSEEGWE